MNNKKEKDDWILSAIKAKYLIVEEDGTVWRRKFASRNGDRMSAEVSKVKFQTHKKSGRVFFNMTWFGVTKSVLANRLIGLAFLPNPLNLPQVNHVDGDKQHNYLRQPTQELIDRWGEFQLEWSTGGDNERHAHRTGLKTGRGSANSNSKLTADQVVAIRGSERTPEQLAHDYGVGLSTIKNVLLRKTWLHI